MKVRVYKSEIIEVEGYQFYIDKKLPNSDLASTDDISYKRKSYPVREFAFSMGGIIKKEKVVIMDDDGLLAKYVEYMKEEINWRTNQMQSSVRRYQRLRSIMENANFLRRLKYLLTKRVKFII